MKNTSRLFRGKADSKRTPYYFIVLNFSSIITSKIGKILRGSVHHK
ncbi:MAG: hypothetical protein HC817_16175 [Saprospiraceae bacterium]|nr:hypothetical protein [Saprospiraceae bacterium]